MGYPNEIPKNCKYWRFQGDHNMIGCQITGALCSDDCDIEKVDPTGELRREIDDKRQITHSRIIRAERSSGTDRVMVYEPDGYCLRSLSGRQYSEVKDAVLKMADNETEFYHRIPHDDPNQPVKEVRVSKEEW